MNGSVWADPPPVMTQNRPGPTQAPSRESSMRTSREIIIYAFNTERAETRSSKQWTQIPSPCNNTPFPATALMSCVGGYGEKEREGGGREREGRKKVERFILFLFSLYVSLSLTLVPPLLNLTIKQHCKNRMFLAEAQQWQSREGTGPYVKEKKKIPSFLSAKP